MSAVSDSWYEQTAARFRAHLSARGMSFPAGQAERLIRDRVAEVAAMMSMDVRTAQRYLDPEQLAETIAAAFQQEAPGEKVLTQPRDVVLPVTVVGRCVAALAETLNLRVATSSPADAVTHLDSLAGELSALGQITSAVDDAAAADGVPMPRGLVLRVIRDLEVAAGLAEDADHAPGDMAAEGRAGAQRLARTFRGDANLLRILISFTTDQPEMGGRDDTSDDTGHDGSSSRA
jgi:hypothetical protein